MSLLCDGGAEAPARRHTAQLKKTPYRADLGKLPCDATTTHAKEKRATGAWQAFAQHLHLPVTGGLP